MDFIMNRDLWTGCGKPSHLVVSLVQPSSKSDWSAWMQPLTDVSIVSPPRGRCQTTLLRLNSTTNGLHFTPPARFFHKPAQRFILRDPFLSPPPRRRLVSPPPRTTWPQPSPFLSLALSFASPTSTVINIWSKCKWLTGPLLKDFQEPRIKEEKVESFSVVRLCFSFDKWSASLGLVWVLQSTRGESRVVESQRW